VNISLFLFAFFISISNSISSIILIFFLIAFLIQKNKKEKIKRLYQDTLSKAIFLFILFVCISFAWSKNNLFFSSINQYVIILFIPILGLLNYKNREKKLALVFFLSGVFFNIILSFLITKLHQYNIINELYFLKNDHYKNILYLRGFIDHSSLSVLTSFSIFIVLEFLFKEKLHKKKIGYFILILILIFFLIHSYGRTGFILFLILSPIYLVFKKTPQLKLLVCFLCLTTLTIVLTPNPLKLRIQQTYQAQNNNLTIEKKILKDAKYMSDSLG